MTRIRDKMGMSPATSLRWTQTYSVTWPNLSTTNNLCRHTFLNAYLLVFEDCLLSLIVLARMTIEPERLELYSTFIKTLFPQERKSSEWIISGFAFFSLTTNLNHITWNFKMLLFIIDNYGTTNRCSSVKIMLCKCI